MVKDPRVIFLDEPTSGLDSEMAYSLFCLLVDLCRLGRTVCLTIHQPNSLITSRFDDFMLLSGGELVYGGPYDKAVDVFAAVGLECPQYTNPTDFFLNVLQDMDNVTLLVDQQKRAMESLLSCDYSDVELGETLKKDQQHPSRNVSMTEIYVHTEASWWSQVQILASRSVRQYIRNPAGMFSETAQYLFMGLFIALMYLQVNNSVETGVQDRLGRFRTLHTNLVGSFDSYFAVDNCDCKVSCGAHCFLVFQLPMVNFTVISDIVNVISLSHIFVH